MARVASLALTVVSVMMSAAATADPATDLHALFEAAWQRDLEQNPNDATYLGDPRYNARWTDLSLEAIEKRHQADLQVLKDLARIPRAALPANEQLNYDLFEREFRSRADVYPFMPDAYRFRHNEGIQTANELSELISFATVRDYEDWLSRLQSFGTYVDQTIAMLDRAVKEKRTQPRAIMQRVPAQLARQVVANPEYSPFFGPFKQFPDRIAKADRDRLTAEARAAIKDGVVPAFKRFDTFFNEKYLPASRAGVGISDTPDGLRYYQNRIAYHTTTRLTADEIHETGLKEVSRIRLEMDRVIKSVGFKGSFAEFLTFLRTDPRFYYKTPEALFDAYALTTKRIDPQLVKLFGKLPRTPYGVRPVPMTSAPDTTTAYYQPPALDSTRAGFYYVNLYKPEVRPTYEIEVLTVHESVPGHHLQIALAQELTDVPAFRRAAGYTAFVEGWGLYSESLGSELGLYTDPYSRFGQLTYEMWRAVRLVVDTGMHAKGWTRQQAIDYFKANAAKTEQDIINEVDRYISWPGQALAYKLGELKIKALRARAQERLGPKFNVREFHDVVLAQGAIPLDVLEKTVDEWVAGRK